MSIFKHEKLKDFVAEQNRFIRTGGLPKNHPNGKLEPFDIPMSVEEKNYWEKEENQSQTILAKE